MDDTHQAVLRDVARLQEKRARLAEMEAHPEQDPRGCVREIYRKDIAHLERMTQPWLKWHSILGEFNV